MTRISAAISNDQSIYAALELSKNSWLLAIQVRSLGFAGIALPLRFAGLRLDFTKPLFNLAAGDI